MIAAPPEMRKTNSPSFVELLSSRWQRVKLLPQVVKRYIDGILRWQIIRVVPRQVLLLFLRGDVFRDEIDGSESR